MKRISKINNKGVALISVMIAVAFISIIASSLLYISFSNYTMKVANSESKKNFYEVEGDINKITTTLRANLSNGSSDPITEVKKYCQDTTDALPTKYDAIKLARIIYPYESSGVLSTNIVVGNSDVVGFNYPGNGDYVNISSSDGNNKVEFKQYDSTTGTWKNFTGSEMNNGLYKITFKNVLIKHISNNTNEVLDNFENTVKTDITIQVSKTPGSKNNIGGIGEFSILMDDQLLISGADFSTMNIYGNSMTAKYEYSNSLSKTIPVNSGGSIDGAGLSLNGDNRVNIMGSYFVVFGDLVISDQSSLYLNGCNMTVYGDIYLKDQGALICSSDSTICMVGIKGKDTISSYTTTEKNKSLIPGRSDVTTIRDSSGGVMSATDLKKHVYPYNITIKRLNKTDSYDKYEALMHFNDSDSSNDGVLYNILNTENSVSGHKLNVRDISDKKDISSSSYYGENVGVLIDRATTQNGGQKDRLIFYTPDYNTYLQQKAQYDAHPEWFGGGEPKYEVLLQESNINSTVISTAPINVNQKHTITLSKIGSDKFDYLTIKYGVNDDRKTTAFHDVELIAKPGGTEVKTKTSIGNFFKDTTISGTNYTPNSLVEALLGCSSDADTTADPITQSVLYLENWEKDFQKN